MRVIVVTMFVPIMFKGIKLTGLATYNYIFLRGTELFTISGRFLPHDTQHIFGLLVQDLGAYGADTEGC